MSEGERSAALRRLHRERPRSRLLRASLLVLAALVCWSWLSGTLDLRGFLDPRLRANLARFLSEELTPRPLRGRPFDAEVLAAWAGGILRERGARALGATAAISVLAIVLAGVLSWILAPLGARTLATREPWGLAPSRPEPGWVALRIAARAGMILLRALPEYLLAFLLVLMLGSGSAWPAVLALALHNAGILGRLGAETVEDLEPAALRSLRAIGAGRRGILATGVLPLALGRYLLYFFYRFETCVREATVLGMLGVVSLGYWIQDARARLRYDEMLFLVLLGAGLVIAADITSALVRRYLRAAV
jgi:phosphonate transport system permease protein